MAQISWTSLGIRAVKICPCYRQTPAGRPYGLCHSLETAADKNKETVELREFLIKFSGRHMQHKIGFTNPALLAGLWIFFSMFEIMEAYVQEEWDSVKATAQQFLGQVV
ncbi:MAG: hypothetical protein R8K48_00250 [Gallionella sp.]